MEEIWKDIEGYEGLYQISNLGRVKSLKYNKEKILKPRIRKDNYARINLSNQGKRRDMYIHRLVAKAFIENPENKPFIDHIDSNPSNNRFDNLRWVNQSENMHNLITLMKLHKNEGNTFICIETNTIYHSLNEAARDFNIPTINISNCCHGKRNSVKGYHFKYIE